MGLTLGLASMDARAQNYPTPGFDCANISSPQELRICRSPRLGELDGLHWHLAERAIKGSKDPERTRADVEGWIAQVRNACETDACLVAAYGARNAELERAVAKLAPPKAPPPPRPLASPPPPLEPAKIAEAIPAPLPQSQPAPEPPVPAPLPAKQPAALPEPETPAPLWPWLLAAVLVLVALVAKR